MHLLLMSQSLGVAYQDLGQGCFGGLEGLRTWRVAHLYLPTLIGQLSCIILLGVGDGAERIAITGTVSMLVIHMVVQFNSCQENFFATFAFKL